MASQMLRFLGKRYGLALVLFVVIVGVVSVARAINGPAEVETVGPPVPVMTTSAGSSAASELGDDSVATSESPPVATAIPGAAAPDVVALDFTRAWMRGTSVSSEQWLQGLEPFSTRGLLDRLKDADPASVPANAVRGPARIRARDSLLADVSIPVSPGTLHLRLIVMNDRWLVDTVDWEQP